MDKRVIDYLYRYEGWLVSPIGWDRGAFQFITMPHIDFCRALGFPVYRATDLLELVAPDALADQAELDRVIGRGFLDRPFFEDQLRQLDVLLETGGPAGGGVFGPLTVASDVLGAERMLRLVRREPGFVHELLDYVTGFMVELARLEEDRGADFFWVAEPVASLLSPRAFEEFGVTYLKRIFGSIDVPGFLHVCGPTLKHTRSMEETGAQVLSIDYLTDLPACVRMVDPSTVIMGNISPIVLAQEDRPTVEAQARELLDACWGYKNVILSSGCALMPGTPAENVEALFDVVAGYDFPCNRVCRQIGQLVEAELSGNGAGPFAMENGIDASFVPVAEREAERIVRCREVGGYPCEGRAGS